MKTIRALAVVVVGFLASGCALTTDEIDVPYEGRANITVVEGADKVTVSVTNVDKRTVYKDRVLFHFYRYLVPSTVRSHTTI